MGQKEGLCEIQNNLTLTKKKIPRQYVNSNCQQEKLVAPGNTSLEQALVPLTSSETYRYQSFITENVVLLHCHLLD